MIETIKMYICPEGCICEQFAYTSNLKENTNALDINEIPTIGCKGDDKNE